MSWYKSSLVQTKKQKWYTDLLQKTFVLRDAKGKKIPYNMEDFQKDFHSASLLALEEGKWENRFVIKSRGIGCSIMSLMDYVMYGSLGFFERVVFPLTSYSQDASSELIRKAKNLILDTEEDREISFNAIIRPTTIVFEDTGCILKAMPGGSDEALRSYRAPAVLFDELEFYPRPDEVYAAGEKIVTEGGIIDAVSTVMSHRGFFYQEYEKNKKEKLARVFEFPLFNPDEFNPEKSLMEQAGEPIGGWFNLRDLDKQKTRDIHRFLREMQCTPVDEGQKFYPLPLILQCVENDINVTGPYRVMGMDVASLRDYAAIVEFTNVDGIWYNTFVDMQRMSYPELEEHTRKIIDLRKPIRFNIDRTGGGEHLSQSLRKEFGSKINGIHFGQRIDKQKVREFSAFNFRILMQDGKVKLSNDENLIRHLNSWNASLTKSDDKDGHGDIAVAAELALLPDDKIPREKTKKTFSGAFGMGKRFGGSTVKLR